MTETIKVGDTMPSGSFGVMTKDGPGSMSTDELFSGKTVALFSESKRHNINDLLKRNTFAYSTLFVTKAYRVLLLPPAL